MACEARGIYFSVVITGVMEVLHGKRETGGAGVGVPVRVGKATPCATLPCPAWRGDTHCWEEASAWEIAVSEATKASQHPVCRGAGHGVRAGRDPRNALECSFMLQMGKLRPKDARLA